MYLDADTQDEAVAPLAVTAVPALRIRAPGGRLLAGHDGLMSSEELSAWLKQQFKAAMSAPDDVLLGSGKPDAVAIVGLARQFGQRDPAVREAAVRRLLAYPEAARPVVLKAFREGNLSERLAALELLREWKAPVEGLDPWRPESLGDKSLAPLLAWAEQPVAATAREKLSAEEIAAAGEQIERMLRAPDAEVTAIRERLARFGPGLLPEVYRRLKDVAGDRDRERLQALRYRLAASDALVLHWPGGVDRLAATDSRERQQAAGELAQRATEQDQPLLLELFSDPDPLVREISLRASAVGRRPQRVFGLGQAAGRPGAEHPRRGPEAVGGGPEPANGRRGGRVSQKGKGSGPDRSCHSLPPRGRRRRGDPKHDAVAQARELAGPREAAASIGGEDNSFSDDSMPGSDSLDEETEKAMEVRVAAYVALVDLLDDPDAFVVSRAVKGLSEADLEVAVEPLVAAASEHPDLAAEIFSILAGGEKMRAKAVPHLRKFCKHEDAAVRAAALTSLAEAAPDAVEEEAAAGLQDAHGKVRIAAADVVFGLVLETRRARPAGNRSNRDAPEAEP